MKLGPATKLDKSNTETLKNVTMMSCRQFVTLLLFLRFMVDLEQFGSRIRDPWSVIVTFSLIVTFYLTKTKNKTK